MRSVHLNGAQNVPPAHFVSAVPMKGYACGHAVNTTSGETDAFYLTEFRIILAEFRITLDNSGRHL